MHFDRLGAMSAATRFDHRGRPHVRRRGGQPATRTDQQVLMPASEVVPGADQAFVPDRVRLVCEPPPFMTASASGSLGAVPQR